MISVIVPVYNAGKYLEDCVESVLSQSYRNLELILVDDGSTDGSAELCDQIGAEDERVRVVHQKNGGVSNARNAGLDIASGDVIAFLDCDDYILPGMYETMMDKMGAAGTRIAICTVMDEQEDGSVRKVDTGETMLITGRDALRNLVTGMGDKAGHRETVWFSVWNKLYDAALFNPVPGKKGQDEPGIRFDPDTDSAEDVPVNLAAFSQVDRIVYYEKPFYFWRFRGESQSNLREPKTLRCGGRTSRYLFDYAKRLPEQDRPATVTASVRHFYWYYTGGVYALSLARKRERKGTGEDGRRPEDYIVLRKYMTAFLKAITIDPFYEKYTERRFKAAVWLMLRTPGLFGALWLFYRRLKRF